jgi:hypothetical protein
MLALWLQLWERPTAQKLSLGSEAFAVAISLGDAKIEGPGLRQMDDRAAEPSLPYLLASVASPGRPVKEAALGRAGLSCPG